MLKDITIGQFFLDHINKLRVGNRNFPPLTPTKKVPFLVVNSPIFTLHHFVSANNVFSLDHVKYSNCEDLSVNYPDMLSVYFGFNVKF